MPPLSKARHERFAQALAHGKTQIEAHEFAGYKPHRGNASSLAQEQSIVERVAEIRADHANRHEEARENATQKLAITIESLLAKAEEARKLAMDNNNPAAAVAAIKEIGVLAGLRVQRSERVNAYSALSDEELARAITEAAAQAGIVLPGSPSRGAGELLRDDRELH